MLRCEIKQRSMSNGFIYVVDAHFIDKIEENKYPGPKCLCVYRQKPYFHFRFNTNSGGFFPMQSFFYLNPQGHQIWA